MSQTVSGPNAAANRLIDALLASLLDMVPKASLVCLNIIDADDGRPVEPAPRDGVTNRVSGVGRRGGMIRQRPPLLDWKALLAPLRSGHCPLLRIAGRQPEPMRNRLSISGACRVLVCPAAGYCGDLTGAVVIVWDGNVRPPGGAALTDLIAAGTRVGGQIAGVLALCGLAVERSVVPAAA